MFGAEDVDPWERQYIRNREFDYPLTDDDAYEFYPEHRWVYDKHELYKRLGYTSIADPMVKPRTNLEGMGRGASVCKNKVAQPMWIGAHYTLDFFIENGSVIDTNAFRAYKNSLGSFTHFESDTSVYLKLAAEFQIVTFFKKYLNNYTGYLNMELIGNRIVEVHLRPSMQFYDICSGLISRKFYKETSKTYSVVFRTREDKELPYLDLLTPVTVRSIQLCWEPGKKLSDYTQDEHSFRYMVINGADLIAIHRCASQVVKMLKEKM